MKAKKAIPTTTLWLIASLILLLLGAYAIHSGGRVTVEPGKVEISAPSKKEAALAAPANKVEQKAHTSGEESRAINSLGDITQGAAPAKRSTAQITPAEISQEAQADGKGAKAMNTAGDINIK